jgi:hypothetical protein
MSRRLKWAEHVACMGREELYLGFWWENLSQRDYLEVSDVDRRIILKRTFKK